MAKKEKSTLVKINIGLYNFVEELVKQNPIEYQSIKHFVEKAIMDVVGFKKYNIGGIEGKYLEERPLKRVVGESKKGFFTCIVCGRFFLRDKKENNEASKICLNCRNTILHFAPKLKQQENEKEQDKSQSN